MKTNHANIPRFAGLAHRLARAHHAGDPVTWLATARLALSAPPAVSWFESAEAAFFRCVNALFPASTWTPTAWQAVSRGR